MVRTLDFHSNNVGSIPASLTIQTWNYHHTYKLRRTTPNNLPIEKQKKLKNVQYSLSFVSFISPTAVTKSRLLFMLTPTSVKKKLLLKQSYLLLTWFSYLTRKKDLRSTCTPTISFRPTKRTILTLTKAPMAHKTFSQEQFIFKFYKFQIRFYVPTSIQLNVNQVIYLALFLHNTVPVLETNLFFLKKLTFNFPSSDSIFLKKLFL